MKTIAKQTTYQTHDGREFEDKAAATRHEALVIAKELYEEARCSLAKLLAEGCKTADGHCFTFNLWAEYHWITEGYFAPPNLVKVEFWGQNWDIKVVVDEGDQVVLIDYKNDCGGHMDHGREFPIHQLYRDKNVAEAALKVAQWKWFKQRLRDLDADEPKANR